MPVQQLDAAMGTWRVGNNLIEQTVQCPPGGSLTVTSFRDRTTGSDWVAVNGSSPCAGTVLRVDLSADMSELAVTLVLAPDGPLLRWHLSVAPDMPVFRTWIEAGNTCASARTLGNASLLHLDLPDAGATLTAFWVEAFAGHRMDKWDPEDANFRTPERVLTAGEALILEVGACRQNCSWIALRTEDGRGLVMGLEYDGAASLGVRTETGGRILFAEPEPTLGIPVAPGEWVRIGGAFVGSFSGDWDEAADLTHRFVERHLARPRPDDRFPYVLFNTWGYQGDIDQEQVTRMVDLAADLGAEAFAIDYGWFRDIGDWHPNDRFPDLRGLTDRIRSLGMKAGLWIAPANANSGSSILEQHPDWTCGPDDWGSFGSKALCLAHEPVKEWAVSEILRTVDELGVDWLKHDFELITACARTDHTHHPVSGDFLSVVAFHEVLDRVLRAWPGLILENCQGGGRMMTFDMVKTHDTSITGDGGVLPDARLRRESLYGATYPFPPRYCDMYQQEAPTAYACRSSMLGGPWILMHRFLEWTRQEREVCREHIILYKAVRAILRDGRIYHLAPPTGAAWDALEAYDPQTMRGVIFVFRPDAPDGTWTVRPRGLAAGQGYLVRAHDSGKSWSGTGATLMASGIRLTLPERRSSEVLYIEPR